MLHQATYRVNRFNQTLLCFITLLFLTGDTSIAETPAKSDSTRTRSVEELIEIYTLHDYAVNMTDEDTTLSIFVYPPFDTLFLDSVGRWYGPKKGITEASPVGFDVFIKDIHRLAPRGIKWSPSRRIYMDPFESIIEYGNIYLTKCPVPFEFLRFTVRIHRVDSSYTSRKIKSEAPQPGEMDVVIVDSAGHKRATIDHLFPGLYTCIIERDTTLFTSQSLMSPPGEGYNFTTIIADSIIVERGHSTFIDPCEIFALQSSRCGDTKSDTCRFRYNARIE